VNWVKSIQETIDYIENHIQEDLTIDFLAKRVFSSQFYFQKVFTMLCDCTVSEYIRNRRMTLAGFDIVDTEISILDMAVKSRIRVKSYTTIIIHSIFC
jgi:AraC family transcriptional regulator